MKLKKIFAAVIAAAASATMMAVSAFAATVPMDTEYAGDWKSSAPIPKSEFAAIGGDVKVVLTVETKKPLVGSPNYLAKPMNMCVSWDAITDSLLSDTAIAKNDGFFVFAEGQTSLEFVVPESVWTTFKGWVNDDVEDEASACLAFQTNHVIIKSAELSPADGTQGAIRRVDEEQSALIMEGKSYEEVTGAAAEDAPAETEAPAAETEAPAAETEAPAADTTTAAPATGNTTAAAIVTVMAVAGAAALISKKRK